MTVLRPDVRGTIKTRSDVDEFRIRRGRDLRRDQSEPETANKAYTRVCPNPWTGGTGLCARHPCVAERV